MQCTLPCLGEVHGNGSVDPDDDLWANFDGYKVGMMPFQQPWNN